MIHKYLCAHKAFILIYMHIILLCHCIVHKIIHVIHAMHYSMFLQILVLGRQRFMGYMYDEEGTHKAVDDKGWFHTGDIGHIDSDGCLFITGRINGNSYDWGMLV